MDSNLNLQVISTYRASIFLPYTKSDLSKILRAMLVAQSANPLGEPISGVELYLVPDAEISLANQQFMQVAGPTNILSFPGGSDLPGTLLLSLDTLQRECLIYGQDVQEHCLRLIAHGMAHLAQLEHGPEHDLLSSIFEDAAYEWLRNN